MTITAPPGPQAGRIVSEGWITSSALRADRFVRIYLPPGYEQAPARRFPVLYLHDGQNAFTSAGDHAAFGWGNWQLDRTAGYLATSQQMAEIIMVAIDCGSERYLEYRGPIARSAKPTGTPRSRSATAVPDNNLYLRYSQFLIEELKPRIDRDFRTLPGPRQTGVMGSSMGGICSLVLAWLHPQIYGLAASISGAFQVERRNFLVHFLRKHTGTIKPIRIYLDSGVVDNGGGDDGRKVTDAVAEELRRIGWQDGLNLLRYLDAAPLDPASLTPLGLAPDKWREAQISQHNEFYWRRRAWRALTFLYPPPGSDPATNE